MSHRDEAEAEQDSWDQEDTQGDDRPLPPTPCPGPPLSPLTLGGCPELCGETLRGRAKASPWHVPGPYMLPQRRLGRTTPSPPLTLILGQRWTEANTPETEGSSRRSASTIAD